jgi:50S ribosomal protein L16 3-hydroxylase
LSLVPDMPLKILAHFEPEEEFVLEPGDMLYLPPKYAHDGIAEGECMTYSIGFRSPSQAELAQEILQRIAEQAVDELPVALYADPKQAAVAAHAEVPSSMLDFAQASVQAALRDPKSVARALGEYLSEPKAQVWFEGEPQEVTGGVRLDRRTRMLYDAHHVFINGESFHAAGRDAQLMRQLADARGLSAKEVLRLSEGARELLQDWCDAGWLFGDA